MRFVENVFGKLILLSGGMTIINHLQMSKQVVYYFSKLGLAIPPKQSLLADPSAEGPFTKYVTHLGGRGVCQKVTLVYKPI